jgi:LysR family hydrogen peroxide-inducible transcriptional activator
MNLPTIRQLTYFLELAETLSFREAAENLHITQSTLSASLAELEAILGEKLLVRHTRHADLTEAGHEILPHIRALLNEAENIVRVATRNRPPLTGKLSVGIIPTIAPYVLPKLLPALQSSYPKLDFNLKEDVTKRQIDALNNGDIDVILMALPYSTPRMTQMKLWAEPFFLVRHGFKASGQQEINLEDLKDENILLLDDGHCLRDHIVSACQLAQSSTQRKTLGATSLQTLIQMVQHGHGATLLPAMAIDPKNIPRGLVIDRFVKPQPTRTIGLVWRKNDPRQSEFELLGRFIKETVYIRITS